MQTCLDCKSNHPHNKKSIYCLDKMKLIFNKAAAVENTCRAYEQQEEDELADTRGRSGGKKKSKKEA